MISVLLNRSVCMCFFIRPKLPTIYCLALEFYVLRSSKVNIPSLQCQSQNVFCVFLMTFASSAFHRSFQSLYDYFFKTPKPKFSFSALDARWVNLWYASIFQNTRKLVTTVESRNNMSLFFRNISMLLLVWFYHIVSLRPNHLKVKLKASAF